MATTTYDVRWSHSGSYGQPWTTAQEASRYASASWGEVEAETLEGAIAQIREEIEGQGGALADTYLDSDGRIHIVLAPVEA